MIKATVSYMAKRSLAPGHAAEVSYTIEAELSDAVPSVSDVKTNERSQGGATETTLHRQDRAWQITFAPVSGYQLELLREFLDSTESGQSFLVYLYGDEATPLLLQRLETGHSETPFMRVGGRESDWFQASITAIENRTVKADGTIVVGGGAGGFGGFGSPYSPGNPGGELDPPPAPPDPWTSPIVFTAGAELGTLQGLDLKYPGFGTPFGSLISGGFSVSDYFRIIELDFGSGYFDFSIYLPLETGSGTIPEDFFHSLYIEEMDLHFFSGDATYDEVDNGSYITVRWTWPGVIPGIVPGNTYTVVFE